MPLPVRRKSRRARPCRFAARSLISSRRASYSFCSGDCGGGMNSSLEAMRVGIGGRSSASASRSHWRTHMGEAPVQEEGCLGGRWASRPAAIRTGKDTRPGLPGSPPLFHPDPVSGVLASVASGGAGRPIGTTPRQIWRPALPGWRAEDPPVDLRRAIRRRSAPALSDLAGRRPRSPRPLPRRPDRTASTRRQLAVGRGSCPRPDRLAK